MEADTYQFLSDQARFGHALVRQVVNEVIHRDPIREAGPLLGIAGVVGPLPGIAQVHIVANGDDDPAFFIGYGAPVLGSSALVFFVGDPALEVLRAGNLDSIVSIVGGVE